MVFLVKRSPEGDAGAGSGGSGSPTPTGTGQQPGDKPATPPASPPAPQAPATPAAPSTGSTAAPEGYVPSDQLRAVVQERDALAAEKRKREEDDAKAKGEFEELASKREQERDLWKSRFVTTARRSAFVASIAKDVQDAEAAYKLALADGLLNDVKVDDDGNADAEAVKKAVKTTTDTYKFLKGSGSFGGERSGQQPESSGFDPNKADSGTLLREGYRRQGVGTRS
jgi:hypothetical protein